MLRQLGFIALTFALVTSAGTQVSAQTMMDLGAASAMQADMQGRNTRKVTDATGVPQGLGGPGDNQAVNADANLDNAAPAVFERGPGFYLNWMEVLASWLVFLMWVYTTDWVSTDSQTHKLQYIRWNPIIFGTFLGFYVLAWLLPWFWLGFPLLFVAYVAPLITYVVYRNQQVSLSERVLTRAHLRYWIAMRLNMLGANIEVERKEAWEKSPVELIATGGVDDRDNRTRLLTARQLPAFSQSSGLIAETLLRRAMAIMLDFSQESVDLRYLIDGVWHSDESQPRETIDPILEVLKLLSGLKPEERRAKQKGVFVAKHENSTYDATFTSQGTSRGERILIQFEDKEVSFNSIKETGMRDPMQEKLIEVLDGENGMVIISAMPASGLRSTTSLLLKKTDRFTREFLAVEDEARSYEKIENIPVMKYKLGENLAEGESAREVLIRAFRMVPNVFVMRDLVDGECVKLLCDQASDEMVVLGTIRAKDCAEALLRILALEAPAKPFAKAISAVLNQRLVRKLCDECKEAYAPTPQVLKQLGIPTGRIQAFHRPPQEPEKICPKCNGVGYYGRTAVFELMIVNDNIRKLLAEGGKTDEIRRAARKAGMQNLQAEGIVLVAKGITSLPELMRVMKQ